MNPAKTAEEIILNLLTKCIDRKIPGGVKNFV